MFSIQKTKRLNALPRTLTMQKVHQRWVKGECVKLIIDGERLTIKNINNTFGRMDILFTDGSRRLRSPSDIESGVLCE